jgi:3-methyladenine DNA glycosylase AlkD
MNNLIEKMRLELEENIDVHTKETGQRFFKENISFYGVKTTVVSRIGKEYFKSIKDRSKNEIFSYCEELWQSGYMEESFIACNWSYFISKKYEPGDFAVFEKWAANYVSNWASAIPSVTIQ